MNVVFVIGLCAMFLGPAFALLGWALRRSVFWLWAVVGVVVLEAAWWIDVLLISSNAGDLSGVSDCYPYCTKSQETAGAALWIVPALMRVFIVGLLIRAASQAARGPRSARGNGPPAASRR